jgi:hypothetical protein
MKKNDLLIAATMTFALAGCGGGGNSSGTSGTSSGTTTSAAVSYQVSGSAQEVTQVNGNIAGILSAPTWTTNGSLPTGRWEQGGSFAASIQTEFAPGVYIGLSDGTDSISLTTGSTISEVAGNGQFAIGRWTNGSDNLGGAYNANQGRTYGVGTPVSVSLSGAQTLNCSLAAATKPTSSTGNVAPGTLNGATVTASFNGGLNSTVLAISLNYSIGADSNQTFTASNVLANSASFSSVGAYTLISRFVGTQATQPYLLLAYGVQAPSTGTVNGMAALSCH